MGEFMDQMLGAGPPLVPLDTIVSGMIPGLGEDLAAGADPVAACIALAACRPRAIPKPHAKYGHLLFGVDTFRAGTDREDAIRAIADVVGAAHGAPAFGSSLGDVPVLAVAAALTAQGFGRMADAWVVAERTIREREALRVAGVRVWEVPEAMVKQEDRAIADACVGIIPPRMMHTCQHRHGYVSVDFSVFGERVTESGPLGLRIPGVSRYVSDFYREFQADYFGMSERGAAKLAETLTRHCGAPRAPRILDLAA